MKSLRLFLAGLILVAAAAIVLVAVLRYIQPSQRSQIRALWVTRFDYDSAEDVRQIIKNTADAGFTDVFFQIRGNGTVFFRSRIEPWAYELSEGGLPKLGTDPGWDPLQQSIEAARPVGLRVHAYMNVLPGWKGVEDPPPAVGQLWTEHPDWFMVDSLGQKMLPTSGWYSFLNPVLPEVRAHLRGIVSELCRYDLAGIHLDYIRYPHDYRLVAKQRHPNATDEEIQRHSEFSYDPASQAALFDQYGWDVSKEQIRQFRCDSVTRIVRDISYVMQKEKPSDCLLSASVMGNPVEGKHTAYQDSGDWARRGLVDWVVQMNYGTRSFDRYLLAMKKAAGRRKFASSVVVGIYCKNDVEDLLAQIETVKNSGCAGFAVFSYSFLFDEQHVLTEKGGTLLPKIMP
ncbi:glycoside hydrolase family 10 protein [Pontiella sulfatireligans]|uniref:Glycosyl hydrolase-like 10 domain-containing protein n=1 Tax=Pontiella sulfatireligans TaxID=2750658 RepID=A0A6C2UWZ2_9BACT|nr:family 10 glycosylhydrolase [Pontiella sulfatireligans]VGO23366.1 hypothetical protein SCARR_05473 [Pontiella sulfatireligans]